MRKLLRDRIHPRKPPHRRVVPPRPVLVQVDLVVGAELLAIIQVLILPDLSGTGPSLRFGRSHRRIPWPKVPHAEWVVMCFLGYLQLILRRTRGLLC